MNGYVDDFQKFPWKLPSLCKNTKIFNDIEKTSSFIVVFTWFEKLL